MANGKLSGLVSRHGKAIFEIGVVSVVGILATAGFQVLAIRGLGPKGFGLLASFLALINVAAIGSSALRNSVAVMTAGADTAHSIPLPAKKRRDSSLVEALVLGGVCTLAILMVSPWLASSLETNVPALIVTAGVILPYFLFARAQGLLQGSGDSRSVVWWSTGAQVVQLLLSLAALSLGFGALGILVVLLVTAVLGTVGSTFQARHHPVLSAGKPFSINSSVVLLITIALAWLTNADVILVRAGAPGDVAGSYAAAAVLVKTILIVPATLSLYLLPRFVNRRRDSSMTRLGVNVTLVITCLSGLAMFAVVSVLGGVIVPILFGSGYEFSVGVLPWLALAWLPWAMAQGILIRLTASSSKIGLTVLLIAVLIQWAGSKAVLPDVMAMIALNGGLGLVVFASLFAIHLISARAPEGER
jgi:O-antigen/teichoic acid export membrane protein